MELDGWGGTGGKEEVSPWGEQHPPPGHSTDTSFFSSQFSLSPLSLPLALIWFGPANAITHLGLNHDDSDNNFSNK